MVHTGRRNVTVDLALKLVRKTVLWDARSVFVFINQKLRSGLACNQARQDLIDAWMHFDVYRMLYTCFDAEHRVQIYSLNPFSVEVTDPELWELVELIELANGGHKYRASFLKLIAPRVEKRHCEDLVMAMEGQKIDNGYPVLVAGALREKLFELEDPKLNTSLVDSYTGLDLNIVKMAMKKMNVTTVVILSNVSGHFHKGQPQGSFRQLMESQHDILVERKYRRNIGEFWRLQNTASDDRSMCVVTRKKSDGSEADNSVIVVELLQYIIMAGIYLVTLPIFVVVLKTGPLQVMMEYYRLSSGHATLRMPTASLSRLVYISMVWMIFFVVTGWLSSNISARMVKSKNPNIDNMRDLVDSNYTIKGITGFQEFFFDDRLARRFINITSVKQCYEELKEGARLACIDDCELAPYNRSIHWLSQPIYQTLIANVVREDWPLLRSYEDLVQWMVEMGLIEWEKVIFFRAKRNRHFDDYVKDQLEMKGRPLKLHNMRILFAVFFSRMLVIALTIFVAEILIDRYLQKKRQNEIIKVLLSLQRDMKKYQLQRRLQDVSAPK
uniref:Ionotropic glutamate receptor C-terminal domain-containing protein n=1 Tax=Trichogramma kaykai TaxID=54128 RepID=A0ABD2XT39_9HYME